MKLGVLISGGGRTLLNLDKQINQGKLEATIAVVISSSRKAAGVERAEALGYPVHVALRKKTLSDEAYSEKILSILDEHNVDLVILAGFLKKFLPGERFHNRCVNIHPSLIPAFCGPGYYGSRVHEAVWKRGCRISGCTVHFVNDHYDDGPIILQRPVQLDALDKPDDIAHKVFEEECKALPEAINIIAKGGITIEQGRVIPKPDLKQKGATT